MKELTEVARSLHQLLHSYGPTWYTTEVDAKLSHALAKADSALAATETESADHEAQSSSAPCHT
jgi:hypothetical protein